MVVLGITTREVVPTCNCFGFSRGCSSNRIFGRSKLSRGASLGESSGGESKNQLMKGSYQWMMFEMFISNLELTQHICCVLYPLGWFADPLLDYAWILSPAGSWNLQTLLVLMVSWNFFHNFQLTMVTLVGLWGICWRKILNPQGTVPWTNRYMMWWYMFNDQKSPYPQWSPHWWV